MRKNIKRLSLSRETLRDLQPRILGWVAALGDTHEIQTGCACTVTCGTAACGSAGCGSAGCGTGTCTREFITTCVC